LGFKLSKKKKLFEKKYLINFRNNNFSDGLDVKLYDEAFQNKLLESLINDCGDDFVYRNLLKKNVGNLQSNKKFKDKFLDNNQFFSIKWLNILIKKIKINNYDCICEIGGGYGCLAEKLIRNFNCKFIMIDLPEANILSSYYLSEHFPEKKIFIYKKNINEINQNILEKFDIFIIPPWISLGNFKVDLFINTRSFMEMNSSVISSYFNLINNKIKLSGYFFNNNRYFKDTVGHPILFCEYPYDNKWEVIHSKESWSEKHCHTLITKRLNKTGNIIEEIKKIKEISKSKKYKFDKYLIKRFLPNKIFNILLMIKNKFFKL